jgi:hypothetical protein
MVRYTCRPIYSWYRWDRRTDGAEIQSGRCEKAVLTQIPRSFSSEQVPGLTGLWRPLHMGGYSFRFTASSVGCSTRIQKKVSFLHSALYYSKLYRLPRLRSEENNVVNIPRRPLPAYASVWTGLLSGNLLAAHLVKTCPRSMATEIALLGPIQKDVQRRALLSLSVEEIN